MRTRLLACLLFIPVLSMAVSVGMEALFNARLKAPIIRMHPEATADELKRVNLRSLCAKKVPQLKGVCSIYYNIRMLRYAGAGAALAGGLALWGLWAALGTSGERRRRIAARLASWQVPLVWLYAAGHSCLAAGCIWAVYAAWGGEGTGAAFLVVAAALATVPVGLMALSLNRAFKDAFRDG